MSFQKNPRDTAEAKFAAKQLKALDARRALSDYEAQARAIDANTARLRALRLAKEAAEKQAAPEKRPRKKARAIPVEKLNASNDK